MPTFKLDETGRPYTREFDSRSLAIGGRFDHNGHEFRLIQAETDGTDLTVRIISLPTEHSTTAYFQNKQSQPSANDIGKCDIYTDGTRWGAFPLRWNRISAVNFSERAYANAAHDRQHLDDWLGGDCLLQGDRMHMAAVTDLSVHRGSAEYNVSNQTRRVYASATDERIRWIRSVQMAIAGTASDTQLVGQPGETSQQLRVALTATFVPAQLSPYPDTYNPFAGSVTLGDTELGLWRDAEHSYADNIHTFVFKGANIADFDRDTDFEFTIEGERHKWEYYLDGVDVTELKTGSEVTYGAEFITNPEVATTNFANGFLRLRGAHPHGQYPVRIFYEGRLMWEGLAERSIEEGRTDDHTEYTLISRNVQHAGAAVTVDNGSELLEPIAAALQTEISERTTSPDEVVGAIVKYNGTATEAAREYYYWTGAQVYETRDGKIGAVWPPDSTAEPFYISDYNTVIIAPAEVATAPLRMVNKAIVRGIEEL